MPILFLYILKLSCSLGVIWLFYRLLLRNLTFHHLNRWYLLGYSLLAFLMPLIDIGPALETDRPDEPLVLQIIPAIGEYAPAPAFAKDGRAPDWPVWTMASCILLLGMLFLLVRIAIRWLALRQLRRSATLVRGGKWKIYQVDETITPFSFGKAIYINRGLHTEKEWEEIILHEYEHVRGRHTVDIIIAEWLTVLNWYNPFAWLIRHSIRQNLEFIADRKVLAGGFDRKDYQYHLLKVVGQPRYQLANNFNFSSLKKRIVMMNKLRSARLHLVKFLFILPLLAVLLVAFRDHYDEFRRRQGGPVYVNAAGIVLGFPDESPLAGVKVRERGTGLETTTDAHGYYKLKIPVMKDSIRVTLDFMKDGYGPDFRDRLIPSLKETIGIIDIGTMFSKTRRYGGVFIGVAPYLHRLPPDPSYDDAVAALKECLKANEDAKRSLALQKAHPEVALFYTTEDKLKQLVVHTDGTVERYGYPGGPTVDDMEKKYGPLPAWSKPGGYTAGSGYLAYWAKISAQAEREFHTTNPTARVIIFPGDSRVIAVDGTGKGRFYDMDNDDSTEKGAFEKKFGKLPDCVPAGYHYPVMRRQDTVPVPPRDTIVIGKNAIRITKDSLHSWDGDFSQKQHGQAYITFSHWPPQPPPLFFVDGIEKDTGVLRNIDPTAIESINVLRDSSAVARYGPRASHGVILIQTKFSRAPKP